MKNLFIGMVLGALFAWVGGRDYLDEKAEEQLYCEMNQKGAWHDSPERYRLICGDAEEPVELLPKNSLGSAPRRHPERFIM